MNVALRRLPLVLAIGWLGAMAAALVMQGEPLGFCDGQVVDGRGRPVAGVSVLLLPAEGAGRVRTAHSSRSGRFRVPDLTAGRYHLDVSSEGWELAGSPSQPALTAADGQWVFVTLRLRSTAPATPHEDLSLSLPDARSSYRPGELVPVSWTGTSRSSSVRLSLYRLDPRRWLASGSPWHLTSDGPDHPTPDRDIFRRLAPTLQWSRSEELRMPGQDRRAPRTGGWIIGGEGGQSLRNLPPGLFLAVAELPRDASAGLLGRRIPAVSGARIMATAGRREMLRAPLRTTAVGAHGGTSVRRADSGVFRASVFTVTDLALIVKSSRSGLLAYVVRQPECMPAAGVHIFTGPAGGAVRGPARPAATGADGLAWLPYAGAVDPVALPAAARLAPGAAPRTVLAEAGAALAAADVGSQAAGTEDEVVYVYTDRPVYRPGQRVYFRGIVRRLAAGSYLVPSPTSISVTIHDSQDSIIHNGVFRTSRAGTFHGAFELPATAAPGDYGVDVHVDGASHYSQFRVAEYRKPEHTLAIRPSAARVIAGSPVAVSLLAQYYFGGPVAGAQVEWKVSRSAYLDTWQDDGSAGEGWTESIAADAGGSEETSAAGRAFTDAHGACTFSFATRPLPDGPPGDQQYRIEVTLTDSSRKSTTGAASVLATRAGYRLALEPERSIVRPGEAARITVLARDYAGRPAPGVRAAVSAALVRAAPSRASGVERSRIAAKSLITDGQGHAVWSVYPPAAGTVEIRAEAAGVGPNRVLATAELIAAKDTLPSTGDHPLPDVAIKLDHNSYRPGDSLRAAITTSAPRAWALLTVEGGTLRLARVVPLRAGATIVSVPVTVSDVPTCYLSVSFVTGDRLISAEQPVQVVAPQQILRVAVTPDRPDHAPRDAAGWTVRTTRPDGRPVAAEVSLAVVDESIFAIQDEPAHALERAFYGARPNEVTTTWSLAERYYGATDKGGRPGGPPRRYFPDTALWLPDVWTDPRGLVHVPFRLPDSLTQWRATAKAVGLAGEVGSGRGAMRASKPLMVRLEAPRFLTEGDDVTVSAIVDNRSGEPMDGTCRMQSVVTDGSGSSQPALLSPRVASFHLPAGGQARADWRVRSPAAGFLALTADARARPPSTLSRTSGATRPEVQRPERYDSVELRLPVQARGPEVTSHVFGGVSHNWSALLSLPPGTEPSTRRLQLTLSPSAAGPALAALRLLAAYPYGCVEQTMSAFLPDLALARLPAFARRLPRAETDPMVRQGLLALVAMQHEDGGWGWWKNDDTDDWMTAYVVRGLVAAKRAGFDLNPQSLARGIDALHRQSTTDSDPQVRAYQSSLLLDLGDRERAKRIARSLLAVRNLSITGRALLAQMLARLGDAPEARQQMRRVWAAARPEDGGLVWRSDGDGWDYRSSLETGAAALRAAMAVEPEDSRLPSIVRGILASRARGEWSGTRDVALAAIALGEYAAVRPPPADDVRVTVRLNGSPLDAVTIHPSDWFGPERSLDLPPALLRDGGNRLDVAVMPVRRVGEPLAVFATADLSASLRHPAPAESHGLAVSRRFELLDFRRDLDTAVSALLPEPLPRRIPAGSLVRVTLSVESERDADHVMLEDGLPAGAEVVDSGSSESETGSGVGTGDETDSDAGWWAAREVHDRRVTFFASSLPAGRHTLRYAIRLEQPGEILAPAPVACEMYRPGVRGRADVQALTVSERTGPMPSTAARQVAMLPRTSGASAPLPDGLCVLGSCTTSLVGRTPAQRANILRALAALDGTRIPPGCVFSYARAVGDTTPERGYSPAAAIVDRRLALAPGGGVCQDCSTVYDAALLAGLPIVERHRHLWPVRSVPPGLDAAYAFGSFDLKFRNPTQAPLWIQGCATVDALRIAILGPTAPVQRVRVVRRVAAVTEPSELVEVDSGLPWGSRRVVVAGGSGLRVIVERVFTPVHRMGHGAPGSRWQRVSEDYYGPVNRIVRIGSWLVLAKMSVQPAVNDGPVHG